MTKKKVFDINSPKLCEFKVTKEFQKLTYNLSDVLREVYFFLKQPQILDDLFAYVPFVHTSERDTIVEKYNTVELYCVKGITSYYSEIDNIIRLTPYTNGGLELNQHLFLHELMHILTIYECDMHSVNQFIPNREYQVYAHCIAFKRALLRADFLYGLLSETQFEALSPLITTMHPLGPYDFEESYSKQLEVPTRQSTFMNTQVRSLNQSELQERAAKKQKAEVAKQLSIAFRDTFSLSKTTDIKKELSIVPPSIIFRVDVSEFANVDDVYVRVAQSFRKIVESYPSTFRNTNAQALIRAVENLKVEEIDPIFGIQFVDRYVDLEVRAYAYGNADYFLYDLYSEAFGTSVFIQTTRKLEEILYKLKTKLPRNIEVTSRYLEDDSMTTLRVTTPLIGTVTLKNSLYSQISTDAQLGISFVYDFEGFGRKPSKIAFDGFFVKINDDEVVCPNDVLNTQNMCFARSMKILEMDFAGLYLMKEQNSVDPFEVSRIISDYVDKHFGHKYKTNVRPYTLFDTDMFFGDILGLLRGYSDYERFQTHESFARFSPILDATELSMWLSETDVTKIATITLAHSRHAEPYALALASAFNFDLDRVICGNNPIGGRQVVFLPRDESTSARSHVDIKRIELHIKKGVPFLNVYAIRNATSKAQETLSNLIIYFDGSGLTVTDTQTLGARDHFSFARLTSAISNSEVHTTHFPQIRANFRGYQKDRSRPLVRDSILDLPIAVFGDEYALNLLEIPTTTYVNEIFHDLRCIRSIPLRNVLNWQPNTFRLVAVYGDTLMCVLIDTENRPREISLIEAWWLLAL